MKIEMMVFFTLPDKLDEPRSFGLALRFHEGSPSEGTPRVSTPPEARPLLRDRTLFRAISVTFVLAEKGLFHMMG